MSLKYWIRRPSGATVGHSEVLAGEKLTSQASLILEEELAVTTNINEANLLI